MDFPTANITASEAVQRLLAMLKAQETVGEASTEELRVALLHYRELFTELLADSPAAASDEQEDDEEDEQEDDQETAVATAVQNR